MQTSHSKTRRPCRGFRNTDIASPTGHKNAKNSKELQKKTTHQNDDIRIIKANSNRYDDLKKIEALLRIHAQAKSEHPEVYQGLYTISTQEKKHLEAAKWGQEWIKHPTNNEAIAWKQAHLANKLKDLESLRRITRTLISLKSQKAGIAMQWCIKHLLIAEEWEEAYRAIKQLKKTGEYCETVMPLEAMCIIETNKLTHKDKISRVNQLGLEGINSTKKAYEIVKTRFLYEKGVDPKTLAIKPSSQKVNRHGAGIERLLAPILMNTSLTEQAIEICEALLRVNPAAKQLRQTYGECLLRKSEWRAGFIEHSAHLADADRWPHIANATIFCDGTLGETLFYSRWLTCLNQGKQKTVYIQQPLLKLLELNFKHIKFLPIKSTKHHKKHKHLPIALLPTYLKNWEKSKTIFEFNLRTEESISSDWRTLLKKESNEKLIAINWHGPALRSKNKRSASDIDLASFSCLTEKNNVKLISLQKGMGRQELENCSFKQYFHEQQEAVNKENRIEHIAGIISSCDAVICDDSGPAHLASNLGKETIVNAKADCSWIWQQNQQTALKFYPNTKTSLFTNNWEETILQGLEKLNLF